MTRYQYHTPTQLVEMEADIMHAARLNWDARQDCWEKGDYQGYRYVTGTLEYLRALWDELQGEISYRRWLAARAEDKLHEALMIAAA